MGSREGGGGASFPVCVGLWNRASSLGVSVHGGGGAQCVLAFGADLAPCLNHWMGQGRGIFASVC